MLRMLQQMLRCTIIYKLCKNFYSFCALQFKYYICGHNVLNP